MQRIIWKISLPTRHGTRKILNESSPAGIAINETPRGKATAMIGQIPSFADYPRRDGKVVVSDHWTVVTSMSSSTAAVPFGPSTSRTPSSASCLE